MVANNQLTPKQRRLQNAIVATGLVGGSAGILTLVLMGLAFMLYGDIQFGHPLAMTMNQLHLTPFMMPRGALDASAWLMLTATYAGLLVSLPAFLIFYWGGPDAN